MDPSRKASDCFSAECHQNHACLPDPRNSAVPLNSKRFIHSRRSIKNHEVTSVQSFEIYAYVEEVGVKARVREKTGGGGEKAG